MTYLFNERKKGNLLNYHFHFALNEMGALASAQQARQC